MSLIIIKGERANPTDNGMQDFSFLAFTDTCEEALEIMEYQLSDIVVTEDINDGNAKVNAEGEDYNVSCIFEDEHHFITYPYI